MEILIRTRSHNENLSCSNDCYDCEHCPCDCDNCSCDNKEGCMGDGYVPNGECIIGA